MEVVTIVVIIDSFNEMTNGSQSSYKYCFGFKSKLKCIDNECNQCESIFLCNEM